MKKMSYLLLALLLIIVMAGCGSSNADIELTAPENVNIVTEDGLRYLTFAPVENAKGYNVYCKSSKYSEDYTLLNDKPVKENRISIPADYAYYMVSSVNKKNESEKSSAVSYENILFGNNTYIYSPSDDPVRVNEELAKIYKLQEANQFGKYRYSIMFKPGIYSDEIKTEIGFYMDVSGLGMSPEDTVLDNLNCKATWLGDSSNHNATCNFWRGVSNLSVNSNVLWAVSQATFMRRMNINGNLFLHDNYGWASGGFLSDTYVTGIIDSGSQQQWLTRNSEFANWTGENWNIVFVGNDEAGVPKTTWPAHTYSSVSQTPAVREKPYLIYKDDEYYVKIPALKKDTVSYDWMNADGRELPLSDFYVAIAGKDDANSINDALSKGKNILFTPGIYKLDKEITVTGNDTVILGIGYATLVSTNGNACINVKAREGVSVSGILFDAGNVTSDNLLVVGDEGDKDSHKDNPILLADVFFRVGGAVNENVSVKACVTINTNDVIGDNFWVWRADHGDGVAWDRNTAENGIIVNGDNVTIYALMVEHFRQYQTVWNGNGGSVYFYQSELPYDVPNQNEWLSHDGKMRGYASYYVGEEVLTHTAYGIGIYSYNRDAIVEEYTAMEIPDNDGMDVHNVCAVMITGNPGISHVINNLGKPCYRPGTRNIIVDYQKERTAAGE